MLVHEGPVDGVAVGGAAGGVLEEWRDKVEAGLDGDEVAGDEREIHAEGAQRRAWVFGAAGEQAAAVAHAESDHVTEAVREEERMRLLFDERFGVAAHHAHRDEAGHKVDGAGEVEVGPLGARHATRDGAFLGGEDGLVEVALKRSRRTDDIGAGDVGGVAVDLGAGVDEDEVAGLGGAGGGREMEDGGVGPGADDGAVAGAGPAGAEELGLEFDLECALADAGAEERLKSGEAGGGRGGGGAERGEFGGVFGAAGVVKMFADAGVEGGIGGDIGAESAEVSDGAAGAGGKPGGEFDEGKAGQWLTAFPDALGLSDGGNEGQPLAVARIVGDHAVDALAAGEIKILGVAEERVGLFADFGERNGVAGADDEEGIVDGEGGGEAGEAGGNGIEGGTHAVGEYQKAARGQRQDCARRWSREFFYATCDCGLDFLGPGYQVGGAMKNITSKLITLTSALALLATFSAPALRAEDAPKKKEPSKKVLEKYDVNKNGKLDPEEEAAWKADMAKKKAEKKEEKKEEKK